MKYRCLSSAKNNNRKIRNLLFLVSMLSLICISHVHAATYNYYFSNSGGGTQCSQQNPCSTLSVARNKIEALNSSDTANLYFARGDKWSIKSSAVGVKTWYGLKIAPTDPIVNINAYGSGDKPIFDGLVSDFNSVPYHNASNGPTLWNSLFRIERANCSINNIEIRRVYGNGILLIGSGKTGFKLQHCNINNFGNCGIAADGGINVTVEYCTFHTGQELYRARKRPNGWGGAIQTKTTSGIKPFGGVTRYNLVYNIYGEGLNVASGVIEYNIIGDTSSIGIDVSSHNWDATEVTVRYNKITFSDWGISIYDNMPGSGPHGIRVADENEGGRNINGDVKIYGNIIINRSNGIEIYELVGDTDDAQPWGPIKVFNNTIIDSHKNNFKVSSKHKVFPNVKIYNNASILYDQINASHVYDALPDRVGWDIKNNAFWTTGGSPKVSKDWRNNYVVSDPKLPKIGWTSSKGENYFKQISFNNIYPPNDSSLVGTGKNLGSGYISSLLTYGSNFSTLPDKATFQMKNNPINANWAIGAIINGGETPISLNKPENLRVISTE